MASDKIHIIFDGRFVEVENDAGESIKRGEWRVVAKKSGDSWDALTPLWELVLDPLRLVMQCEAHQGVVWPHDDCPGPGMPLREHPDG